MMIRKLTASFGKLENESLSFHDGLNVIYAPNESGKSTWCAFIQAMLYGVDSTERARAGHLPDKLRYAPWSGAPMEGSMELTADRCDITITRTTHAKNAPMREFTATYTGTNTPVDGMTGQNAGELLTGVTKDVFRRTAFVGQGAVAVSGSPDLEKRISAIVTTGEEQSSYTETSERLRAWQRKRRFNRRGMLPELEGEMDELQKRLDDMGSSVEDVQKLEKELEETRQDCARLEEAVTESRKRQRREAINRLNSGRGRMQAASDMHDESLALLSERREELRQSDFGEIPLNELQEQVQADREELQALERRRKAGKALWPAIVCFLLAAIAAAVYTYRQLIPLMIAAGVFCAAAVVLLLRYSKARQTEVEAAERKRQLLKKYRAASSEDLGKVLERRLELEAAVRSAEDAERASREAWEKTKQQVSKLEESAITELDFTGGDTEAARLSRELTAARGKAEHLSAEIAQLNGRLSAMGDPLVLASSLSCLREDYEQIQS
ncbi:MAG: AAA family ATPase, partial [Oscillospiraceae bacterium]|nr:AAA family ATPase [Oscillospiraceae bacterium]